ncbi:MAG: efflux RND transporter periplasmic adaptor subunit [Candidatus Ornithospirochaeta sp.]
MKRLLRYIGVVILLALAFLAVALFYSTREKETYVSPSVPVQVTLPQYRTIGESYTVTGYVEAEAMVPVVPFVKGTIMEFYAENGMEVKKDQVLAVVDTEPYELQKKQAEAAFLAYDATLERVSALYEKGAATKQNYDEVKAQRDAGKAQYDLASLQLSYCYVDSPVDGTVLMSQGSVGSIATGESPIAVVADLSSLIVNLTVPEKYFSQIDSNKEKLKITVERKVNGGVDSVSATLVSVSPYIDPATKTFNVKVRLDGDVSAFRPGMMVSVTIIYREENVLSLPLSAKKLDGGIYAVTEKDDGSTVASFLSLPSLLSDDSYFQVEEKYKDTLFITRGQTKVLDGEKVEIKEGY